MNVTAIAVFGLLFAADAETSIDATQAQVRQVVERSLPFLETGSLQWVEMRKCVTCHHVPMMIWTHHEAKKRGFRVNDAVMSRLSKTALSQYLDDPEMTPTGQDKGFMEKPLGPGTIFLTLALQSNPNLDDEAAKAIGRFRDNFVKYQGDDGSWATTTNQPPIVDGQNGMTMLILIAMGKGDSNDKYNASRQKIRRWLSEATQPDETQPLSLRIVAANILSEESELDTAVARLLARQRPEGGWNQKDGLPTDAMATGQALYALTNAGMTLNDNAIRKAVDFLTTSQQQDGSWPVQTQNPNAKGFVVSYYGTAWATLGLLQTLAEREEIE